MMLRRSWTPWEQGAGSGAYTGSGEQGAVPSGTAEGPAPRSPLPGLLTCLVGLASFGAAQIPTSVPPPAQAQAALQQAIQQNPGLADILRQRLQQSGLTPDQIRSRLQASGYPANLLDAYLGGTTPGQPSVTPGANELAAVTALGLAPITLPVAEIGRAHV